MTEKEKDITDKLFSDVLLKDDLETSTIDKPFELPVEILEFVGMEYKLIDAVADKNKYFEWKRSRQSLKNHNDKRLDIIDIVYKQTQYQDEYLNRTFYFDITKCFERKSELYRIWEEEEIKKEQLLAQKDITTIIATTKNLKEIITAEIEKYGNNANLNHIDVSNVTSMKDLFNESKFNGDISKWDVSKVTNMNRMFSISKFNDDISKWDVSKVTNMRVMFHSSKFTGDISKWNVSKVTTMGGMFCESPFNGDISNWNMSKVTDMSDMFENYPFKDNVSEW